MRNRRASPGTASASSLSDSTPYVLSDAPAAGLPARPNQNQPIDENDDGSDGNDGNHKDDGNDGNDDNHEDDGSDGNDGNHEDDGSDGNDGIHQDDD